MRESGFEVLSIGEEFGGISDIEVLQKAVVEELIILTFDRDYGELLFKYHLEAPPAIIYFRNKGLDPKDAGIFLIDILSKTEIDVQNMFTVISDDGIRQRKLR